MRAPPPVSRIRGTHQLELLDVLDAFCKENGLTYYLFGGTMLGAIRHKGFIPWDDDLDLCMPKKDYDILIEKFPKDGKYVFLSPETDPSCVNYFGKIMKKGTKYVEYSSQLYNPNQGIYIDIMPILPAPNFETNVYKTARFWIIYQLTKKSFPKTWLDDPFRGPEVKSARHKIIDGFLSVMTFWMWPSLARKIRKRYINRMDWPGSNAVWIGGSPWSIYRKEWFTGSVYVAFENRKCPAPTGYKEYLTKKYGDYMAPPPKKETYNEVHPVVEFKA